MEVMKVSTQVSTEDLGSEAMYGRVRIPTGCKEGDP
jgi:hypothetical protein